MPEGRKTCRYPHRDRSPPTSAASVLYATEGCSRLGSVTRLQQSVLFRELAPAELKFLEGLAKEQRFAAGQPIFQQGDAGLGLFVIGEGAVDIATGLGEGEPRVLSRLGPGDFFGEMAVLEDQPRSASAVAASDTRVYFLPRQEFLALVNRSPGLAMTLLREISRRLRDFSRRHVEEVLQAERLAVVGRFARSIIHDLKNPLSVISLSAELAARQGNLPASSVRSLEMISKQVDRIVDLVAEILEFTGASTQGEEEEVDFGEFLVACVRSAKAEAELRSVDVTLETPLPHVRVKADYKRLRRVFDNLVGNAIEALDPGGQVQVVCRTQAGEVVTEVRDNGAGISAEIAGRLFQPFATHGKVHGSGLGLSICKRIIEDHAGWIKAWNDPGGGAVFAFGLPAVPQSPDGT